jgi:hypothetical protein
VKEQYHNPHFAGKKSEIRELSLNMRGYKIHGSSRSKLGFHSFLVASVRNIIPFLGFFLGPVL